MRRSQGNRCCTGVVQQDQSTGGQTSRLEVPQELCEQGCTGISRLTAQCSRLGFFPKVLAVDLGSNQSTGSVPGAADAQVQSTAVKEQSTGGTAESLGSRLTAQAVDCLSPSLKHAVDWWFDQSTGRLRQVLERVFLSGFN